MSVHGAQTNVHLHQNGALAMYAALQRRRNSTIVIGGDQKDGVLLLDIDVQAEICEDAAELIGQLRLVIEALEGQDLSGEAS